MQYDFNLPANGGQVIDVKGRFVKYRSGTGPIRVRLSKGGYADLMPGQGIFETAFDSLTVNDRTGAQNIGVILAGDFDFRDDRITGTVDVVDGGKSRTIANQAFMGGAAIVGAAGEYSYVQLLNSSASTRVVVKAVVISVVVAQGVGIAGYSTPLTTLVASAQSKMVGGAASASQLRIKGDVAAIGAAAFVNPNIVAGAPFVFTFQEPIVLMPGQGLIARGSVVNSFLGCNFEFTEEAI